MSTLFAAALAGLGLSQSEAAAYLDVRPDTVKSWCSGRRTPAPGAWAALHALARKQRLAAEAIVASIGEAKSIAGEPPAIIELAHPSAAEIRRRGWPCEGVFVAVVRRAWEAGDGAPIRLVERGSTEAVRAAERIRRLTE